MTRKWSFFDELFRSKDLKEEMKHNADFAEEFCWIGWPVPEDKP